MPVQTQFDVWYDYSLLQMAADSYLDDIDLSIDARVRERLKTGNNDIRLEVTVDGDPGQVNKLVRPGSQYFGATQDTKILPGATRMTDTQVTYFQERYEIVHHHKSDVSGFSGTLFRDKQSGRYVLSFRSTEFSSQNYGGDRSRDNSGANDEIALDGFAFGQLKAMEDYYLELRANYIPSGSVIDVTGYSLGSHLATVFTELHSGDINKTYLFNGAGRGRSSLSLQALINAYSALLDDPDAIIPGIAIGNLWPWEKDLRDAAKVGRNPFISGETLSDSVYDHSRHKWAVHVLDRVTTGNLWLGLTATAGDEITAAARSKIEYLYGMGTHSDATGVALSGITPSERTRIFVEDQPDFYGDLALTHPWIAARLGGSGDFLRTHSITLINDSLALMRTIKLASSSIDQLQIETIFAAASNQRSFETNIAKDARSESDSLERVVDALYKILLPGSTFSPLTADPTADGFGNLIEREKFHARLGEIHLAIESAGTSPYVIRALGSMTWVEKNVLFRFPSATVRVNDVAPAEIINFAKQDTEEGLAYRYALWELNPFVVIGAPYTPAIREALKLLNPATGAGVLTEEWLSDRTSMLLAKVRRNIDDLGYARGDGVPTQYVSHAGKVESVPVFSNAMAIEYAAYDTLLRVSRIAPDSDAIARRIFNNGAANGFGQEVRFGGDSDESFNGTNLDDRLYGGAGDDRLSGGRGKDYLQGDAGHDSLAGGVGDDKLVGGKGDDALIGGAGVDHYVIRKGDGNDAIIDFAGDSVGGDGLGSIDFLGQLLDGTKSLVDPTGAQKIWTDELGYLYEYVGIPDSANANVLKITKPGEAEGVTILGYKNGDLGITLSNLPEGAPRGRVIIGDFKPAEFVGSIAVSNHFLVLPPASSDWRNVQEVSRTIDGGGNGSAVITYNRVDDLGNLITGVPEARADSLYGSAGPDDIRSGELADDIDGKSGNDLIDAANGDDRVRGGLGSDEIRGGAGRDVIFGEGDSDRIVGGGDNDVVAGGDQEDVIEGGDGTDYLAGGSGKDILFGGNGNDFLTAAEEIVSVSVNWTHSVLWDSGSTRSTATGIVGDLIGSSDDGDYLDGGAGDDLLHGGFGRDVLMGGVGRDGLNGLPGSDLLMGGDDDDRLLGDVFARDGVLVGSDADHGDDELFGGVGNDRLIGHGGADSLYGEDGNDTLYGDTEVSPQYAGEDYLDGGVGEDMLYGGAKGDRLYGGSGNDSLYGDDEENAAETDGADLLDGQEGNDFLRGHGGDDILFGGAGDDTIHGDGDGSRPGETGNDRLIGGVGSDVMYGGAGNDVYEINLGDGGDAIHDAEGINTVLFGPGIAASSVTLGQGADVNGNKFFVVHYGDLGDYVAVKDGFTGAVQYFRFSDGAVLTPAELVRKLPPQDRVQISGGPANDVLASTGFAETLAGDGGADTYVFSRQSGHDLLVETFGADRILFVDGIVQTDVTFRRESNGDLTLHVRDGGAIRVKNQFIAGANGIETIEFSDGATLATNTLTTLPIASIDGEDGDDILIGTNNDDTLVGLAGNDSLSGGQGSDTYVIYAGDGIDSISDNDLATTGASLDRIQFRGIDEQDVVFERGLDNSLIMASLVSNNVVLVPGYFSNVGNRIEEIQFFSDPSMSAPDQTVTAARLLELPMEGTAADEAFQGGDSADVLRGYLGNDVLQGLGGDDLLDGGVGDDTLIGASGSDTYLFGRGYGSDRIQELDGGQPAIDRVDFSSDVAPADIAVTRVGSDLLLTIIGATESLTVEGYFESSSRVVEEFRFSDGTIWDEEIIAQLFSSGTPGADVLNGSSGNDLLSGLAGNDTLSGRAGNDRLYGGSGFDTLHGEAGDDQLDGGADGATLNGGLGGDTYVFGRGYGVATINEIFDATNPIDQIQFNADVVPTDVLARRVDDTLVLTIAGTGDAISVSNYFASDATTGAVVELVRFADGTIWDVADIKTRVSQGTESAETLIGFASDDTISALGGNDVLLGFGGNDVLDGGAGTDSLWGGSGDDNLNGGAGNDTLSGETGNDTYTYALGSGDDTIDNLDNSSAIDQLILGAGILPSTVALNRGGANHQDLVLLFNGAAGKITIRNYFTTGSAGVVDEIRFADDPGTVWTLAGVKTMLITGDGNANSLTGFDTADTIDGLGGDDYIQGLAQNDVLSGSTGNDQIRGDTGDDQLDGGAGDDRLYGNAGNDVLVGGAGSDVLYGEEYGPPTEVAGSDTLDGGAGLDYLHGREGNDVYIFGRGYGHDEVDERFGSAGNDTLRLNAGIATTDVTLTRQANDLVVSIAGDPAQAWVLDYFALTDKPIEQIVFNDNTTWDTGAIASRVVAGTQNAMAGTAGNDTFAVDHTGDTITEGANQGTDLIQSSVSYTLPANVENLTLTGALDLNATGNSLDNTLTGNAGDNRLDGAGGADTLIGGVGDDSYMVNDANGVDSVIEAVGGGTDTITTDASFYTLADNVENVVLQSNSAFTIHAFGNSLDNTIDATWRNFAGTEIDGGAGADRMIGSGSTSNIYWVDNVGDVVVETTAFDGEFDLIKSTVSYALPDQVEDLTLLGTAAITATGNAKRNRLDGSQNAAANTLAGGLGDDIYIVGAGDGVLEQVDAGTDEVQSSASYTLGANIERLTLIGAATINGSGNALDNVLTGNSAANVLDGGAGADAMRGGGGNDMYMVDHLGDSVSEWTADGFDTVNSSVSFTLHAAAEIERLVLTGTQSINATGNGFANILDGSPNTAANILTGGLGDDTYIAGTGDTIVENAGEGSDTVQTDVSFALSGNIENLILAGDAAISGTGDAGDNDLDGSQNTAANVLTGGLGDDTYYVDELDVIVENAGEGTDTVVATTDYTLAANLENLTLDDAGSGIAGIGNDANNVLTGNSLDNLLDGGMGSDTLRGLSGNDTYVVHDASDTVDETDPSFGGDAGGNDTVQASVSYSLGVYVENLTLVGSASISATGNALSNRIDGVQNSAANTLIGGLGNDIYVVDAGDVIVENTGEGTDTVESAASYTIGANVENLTLTGTAAVNAIGNTLANTLRGNAAANVLDGGTGVDTMIGGADDDTYVVDATGDVVTESANEGIDTVLSAVTRTLGNNLENLTLTGVAAINGTGNTLANVLRGNNAANTLSGGTGDDFYYVSTGDTVSESASGGTDTVFTDVSWTLGSNLERLTLIGAGNINATGNSLANMLAGNAGNNTLSGGTGADQMFGGAGDDLYVVENAGDLVTENASEGIDTVQSARTYTLTNNVENLTLTGSTAINGTGNTLDNVLTGNSAANQLSGGLGDDIYIIASTDTVTESANAGIDQVRIGSTYTLGTNVEALLLTGTTAINGTGNALNNLIAGNSANNTLNGGTGTNGNDILQGMAGNDALSDTSGKNLFDGGAGADTMIGGAANDLFVGGFGNDTITTGTGADIIAFNRNDGQDTVNASSGVDNTVSIGGGVTYADMRFAKSGSNLILKLGGTDQITLKDWYLGTTNKSVLTLQVVAEAMAGFDPGASDPLVNKKVTQFNFQGLTTAFDQALVQNPGLTDWALTNGITTFQLSGSDTQALGGDLAYWYGKNGNFTNLGYQSTQDILNAANFGSGQQALQANTSLQTGAVRLS